MITNRLKNGAFIRIPLFKENTNQSQSKARTNYIHTSC